MAEGDLIEAIMGIATHFIAKVLPRQPLSLRQNTDYCTVEIL